MAVTSYRKEVLKTIRKVSKDNIFRAVFLVQADAIRDVNVDTGRHRASITAAVSFAGPERQETEVKEFIGKTGNKQLSTAEDGVEKPEAGRGEYVGVVGSNVEYAIYRELDKPSLTNALHKNRSEIEKLFNKSL